MLIASQNRRCPVANADQLRTQFIQVEREVSQLSRKKDELTATNRRVQEDLNRTTNLLIETQRRLDQLRQELAQVA